MKLPIKQWTVAELRDLMTIYLQNHQASPDEVKGYVKAQELSGWLRPGAPGWLRNSAALYYQAHLNPKKT